VNKCVVVSDHKGFKPGQPGETILVDIIVENQSKKNVPKQTYVYKADKDNKIEFEPVDMGDKIRKSQNRLVKLSIKLPETPGEYR
jgi:hypothetical protein